MPLESTAPKAAARLAGKDAARVIEFARICKAAARAVILYPSGHPTVASTLGRLVELTSAIDMAAPLRISVLADALLLEGRAPATTDSAIAELAALLHTHSIGELTVHSGGDADAWTTFFRLLGRSPEDVREEGGIAQVWARSARHHLEIREIDYAEVLRERDGTEATAWEEVVARCLQGRAPELSETAVQALRAIAGDAARLAELVGEFDARAALASDAAGRSAALLRLFDAVIKAVEPEGTDRMESVKENLAAALGQLSPDTIVALLSQRDDTGGRAPELVDTLVGRMPDDAIAQFVARNAADDTTSIERLAEAFHALVRDGDERQRLVALAHDDAAASPLGSIDGFEDAWDDVAKALLTSYSDKPFVSDQYARELSRTRVTAIEVEQVSDDPPERLAEWLQTVAASELRRLDLTLVLDLLRIEEDPEHWSSLMSPVVALLEDLLLVGDFDAAGDLLAAIAGHRTPYAPDLDRRATAAAMDRLVAGPAIQHIVPHLATIDDAQFERLKIVCLAIGDTLIGPITDALTVEELTRPRERMAAILAGFGAAGCREVDRLKNSPNAAVRRTAVRLLQELRGGEALAELARLLDDSEPQVQREAVRAILSVGGDRAYGLLEHALLTGTDQSRDAVIRSLGSVQPEDAAPLFMHVLQDANRTGRRAAIRLQSIEALGALRAPQAVAVLKETLYRGEWWAPRRTAAARGAAAAALARIGTADAAAVLREAMTSGPRGVRAAARSHIGAARRTSSRAEAAR